MRPSLESFMARLRQAADLPDRVDLGDYTRAYLATLDGADLAAKHKEHLVRLEYIEGAIVAEVSMMAMELKMLTELEAALAAQQEAKEIAA